MSQHYLACEVHLLSSQALFLPVPISPPWGYIFPMSNTDKQQRLEELAQAILRHQDLYYNSTPEISDAAFDALWDELRLLAPNHEIFQRVGSDSVDGFEKREHLIPMNSQDKASTAEQFTRWGKKVAHRCYVVQHKLDGASLELQYEDGEFRYGVTRGDGRVGDDISANVRRMAGVPMTLRESFSGAVRGEVIMTHRIHEQFYADKANCRNAANGLMRRKDGVGSEHLHVMCYDALSVATDDHRFTDEEAKLRWLEDMGFSVVPYRVCATAEEVIHYRDLVGEERPTLPYDIDGLVVKGPDIDLVDAARTRPQKQIAFKFSAEEGITILRDVEWSESGHLYTPVGILEPVQLAGTTVRRASLVHPELIAELGVAIGCEVVVTKRGDIIPKIERVLRSPGEVTPIVPPSHCSTCGTAVVHEAKRVYCPNPTCPRRAFHRLQKWITVLDVRDFGDVLLQKVFDASLVREIADLYRLKPEDLAQFPGVGMTSATKALSNLRGQQEIPLSRFLAGFDLGGIAELKIARMVDAGYDTLDKLHAATVEELSAADGIAELTAQAFKTAFEQVRPQIDALLATGEVHISAPSKAGTAGEAGEVTLQGQTFCFTGALERCTRSDAERLVRAAGGEARSSVSAGLTWLVTNDPSGTSSKLRKARDLDVQIITEEEFFKMLPE